MLTVEDKQAIVTKYGKDENDTGATEVQIALLTSRIIYLTGHFKKHIHDHHSRRGLLKLVGSRKQLLKYLKKKNINKYRSLIADLGIRK
ncbi:MAG: 30S ribosomal protein S15 [SAR324 cluster bacterium]|uniref:Small ribosomal subunit protein uS15 n=1 Tax=SAR324 cluster bacterium TaxID=2024889 RepID=A0A2A4T694_9DELT|nr:MAG: 30S ribosomal protein S15 [SAR324 cluster bacterium]